MIYIITHKDFEPQYKINKDCYLILAVGNAPDKFTLRDNTGDNISDKNNDYSELTGQYWIWKNTTNEIKGYVHYRRLFLDPDTGLPLTWDKIESLLSEYDMIVPQIQTIKDVPNTATNFLWCHGDKALELLNSVARNQDFYFYQNYQNIMFHSKSLCPYNIMIARKEVFDEYSEWLFKFLEEARSAESYEEMAKDEKLYHGARMCGAFAERLRLPYIIWKKIKIVQMPLSFLDPVNTPL